MFLKGDRWARSPRRSRSCSPPTVRYSGTSLGQTLGIILGGAIAPLIAAALYDAFASSLAVGLYITLMAGVSWISVLDSRDAALRGTVIQPDPLITEIHDGADHKSPGTSPGGVALTFYENAR